MFFWGSKGFVNLIVCNLTIFRFRCPVEQFHILLSVLTQWDKAGVASSPGKSACVFNENVSYDSGDSGVASWCFLSLYSSSQTGVSTDVHPQTEHRFASGFQYYMEHLLLRQCEVFISNQPTVS